MSKDPWQWIQRLLRPLCMVGWHPLRVRGEPSRCDVCGRYCGR